jgi:hypothetical protein
VEEINSVAATGGMLKLNQRVLSFRANFFQKEITPKKEMKKCTR